MISQAGLVLQHGHELLGQLALVRQQRRLHVQRLTTEARQESPDLARISLCIYYNIYIYIIIILVHITLYSHHI